MSVDLKRITQSFQESPFWNFLGLEVEDLLEGQATLKLKIRPSFINVKKSVHGGIYASILDTTMGMTARTLGYDEVATIQLNIQYLKPIESGTVISVGKVVNKSRSTALMEGKLFDDNDNLIAHCTGTFKMSGTGSS